MMKTTPLINSTISQALSLFVLLTFMVSCKEKPSSDQAPLVENTPSKKEGVKVITFGLYTTDKATTVVEEFAPTLEKLEAHLTKELQYPVDLQFKITSEYGKGIQYIEEGTVDFSRLGPASFIIAKKRNPNLELLAMESKKGERVFNGIIAVHRDSDFKTISDLKGHSFAFGDPLSTIGRYLSQAELLKVGLTHKDFSKYEYVGRHDTVGMAVAAGSYSAGALKESTFKTLVENGEPIRALMKFDNVTKPWVAHPKLDREVIAALRSGLLDMETSSVSKDGFLTASEEYYAPVEEAMALSKDF
ncbi:MAG: PhnD/SsuA/transferrin family substrate-binding protein [Verrucomicrobiales bacterium]|nr:PhnD/SsuA/transferrin family substrate-binding protein [Verrucomicrobiales bacterium]